MALNNTAAAAKSFIIFISVLISLFTKSASLSIDEFIISEIKTSPIASVITTHSIVFKSRYIPRNITHIVAIR